MDRKNTIIIVLVAVLAVAVGVAAFLNSGNLTEKRKMQQEAKVVLKDRDGEIETIGLGYITGLHPVEFSATLDTSNSGPREQLYTGIELKKIFSSLGIDSRDYSTVLVKAVDGYTVALTMEEVLKESNIYLAYQMNGESLGTKEEGGSGPYQLIVREDQFSQRWCKFVTEVILEE
ncbi:MAG: molybdopterin-dependent oxidoreductase [Candidatus Humimicrobiaceae bacterium]